MAHDLVVRLPSSTEGALAWREHDGDIRGQGGLGALAQAGAGRRVHLLVSGSAVLIARVAVPAQQRGRALAAIPWALEDRLAEDVGSLHFAVGERHDNGEWSVAVIAREVLDRWLDACATVGIEPASMGAEPLSLPAPAAGEWVALEEPGQITVRTAVDGAFACEPGMLGLVAAALEKPARIRRLGAADVAWPPALAAVLAAPEPLEDALAAFTASPGIELLQGPYDRRERSARQLRRWRLPAVIAVGVLAVFGARLALDYNALGAREAELHERLQTIFQKTFPDVQQVRDPRARMAARLRLLRDHGDGGADFADLLAGAGGVLSGRSGARLSGLTWRGEKLEVEVGADDLQALDRVRRGLVDAGLSAELRGADRREGGIDGRITVSEAGT